MIRKPEEQGQSIWLEHYSQDLVSSGALVDRVQSDGVCGVKVEPAVLAPAPVPIGEKATLITEVRDLADILHPIYVQTRRRDGYVSLPVDPAVWNDTEATLCEARRLWNEISRENLLLAIPATDAGIPAISALIAGGINVNATMLFTPQQYEQAALAYLDGLEKRAANLNKGNTGKSEDQESANPHKVTSMAHITSIASFFSPYRHGGGCCHLFPPESVRLHQDLQFAGAGNAKRPCWQGSRRQRQSCLRPHPDHFFRAALGSARCHGSPKATATLGGHHN